MIRLSDYAYAYIIAILGMLFIIGGGWWVWYALGGYLIGKGVRLAFKAGRDFKD
jgi:hypothetical protein